MILKCVKSRVIMYLDIYSRIKSNNELRYLFGNISDSVEK
jgi:hypothetical protein